MGAGQCAQHCTGITAALLRDLPAHAAGPGSSLTCDGTVPDAGTNGRGSQLSSLPPIHAQDAQSMRSSNVCSTA
jgi:hypothetical protein